MRRAQGVPLTQPGRIQQLGEALGGNTTCEVLELCETGLTDGALQQLAAVLAVPSRCPKLRALDLRGNPGIGQVGETVAQGLSRLRAGLEVRMGEGLDATRQGFVHDKQVVIGLTSWSMEELRVPDTRDDVYCPKEVSGEGERVVLTRGFQGPNGTKYKCELATFEMYHQTGNLVLLELHGGADEDAGVVV